MSQSVVHKAKCGCLLVFDSRKPDEPIINEEDCVLIMWSKKLNWELLAEAK